MARTPKAADGAEKKPARPVGPLVVYAILRSGADKNEVRNAIAKVTTNKSELLSIIADEESGASFIKFTVQRAKRAGKDVDTVSVE